MQFKASAGRLGAKCHLIRGLLAQARGNRLDFAPGIDYQDDNFSFVFPAKFSNWRWWTSSIAVPAGTKTVTSWQEHLAHSEGFAARDNRHFGDSDSSNGWNRGRS